MSSQWAPMQSTVGFEEPRRSFSIALTPDLPRRFAAAVHAVEGDLVLERIHRHPEAFVLEAEQRSRFDESRERLLHELLAGPHVLEQLLAEDHVAAVDPQISFLRCR